MKVLLFGATGSAGGSVLRACLSSPEVEEVRAVTRRPLQPHEKLRGFVHDDYLDYGAVADAFTGVDACFYCLGISATQVPEEADYRKVTHAFALAAAKELELRSPGAAFHFLSGQGASLRSGMMWARVKAETERDLIGLVSAVCWRPGYIDGEPSQSGPRIYQTLRPLFRLFKPIRSLYVTGEDIGRAMIRSALQDERGRIVENAEIRRIASA